MRNRLLATTIAVALLSGAVMAGQPRDDDRRGPRGDRPGSSRRDEGPRPDRRPGPPGRFGRDGSGPMHMGRGMHGFHGGMGMGAPINRLARLDLTAEQKTKIIDAMTANFKSMLEARFMMMDAASKLRDARRNNLGDEALIAAHRDMGEATGRLQALRGKAFEQIKAILTDEQKAELDKPGRRWDGDRPGMRPDRRDRDDDRRMGPGPRHGRRDDDRRWDDRRMGPGPRHGHRWDDSRWDRRPPRHHRWSADMDDDGPMDDDLDVDDDAADIFEDDLIED